MYKPKQKTETKLKTSTAMLRQAMIFDGSLELLNFEFSFWKLAS